MSFDTEQRLRGALEDLVAAPPIDPDLELIERRGRTLKRRATARTVVSTGIAGLAVAGIAVTATLPQAPGRSTTAAGPRPATASTAPGGSAAPGGTTAGRVETPLIQLADYIEANPGARRGDATLIRRNQTTAEGKHINVVDLYGDNGTYFFARTLRGLPAEVKANHSRGDRVFQREVQAAIDASRGDVNAARLRMATAPAPGAAPPTATSAPDTKKGGHLGGASILNNWIWENSQDALIAGAGRPEVREGVLRILATLPDVKVTHTTTDGKATLTLTSGEQEVGAGYQEQLTLDAATGIPVTFSGGASGHHHAITVRYEVSRVSLSDVAAGKL